MLSRTEEISAQIGKEVIDFCNERLQYHVDKNFSLDPDSPNVLDVQDLVVILMNTCIIIPPAVFGVLKDLFKGKDLDFSYMRAKIINTIAKHLDMIIEAPDATIN